MNKELAIEYEVFEEEGEVVLSVVDKEKDEVLNMFKGKWLKIYIGCFQVKKGTNYLLPIVR